LGKRPQAAGVILYASPPGVLGILFRTTRGR